MRMAPEAAQRQCPRVVSRLRRLLQPPLLAMNLAAPGVDIWSYNSHQAAWPPKAEGRRQLGSRVWALLTTLRRTCTLRVRTRSSTGRVPPTCIQSTRLSPSTALVALVASAGHVARHVTSAHMCHPCVYTPREHPCALLASRILGAATDAPVRGVALVAACAGAAAGGGLLWTPAFALQGGVEA
jgi:hypothetical protein